MVDMCRNEDGEFSARSKEYLHKTSLFLVYVGQYSDRRALHKEKVAMNKTLLMKVLSRETKSSLLCCTLSRDS